MSDRNLDNSLRGGGDTHLDQGQSTGAERKSLMVDARIHRRISLMARRHGIPRYKVVEVLLQWVDDAALGAQLAKAGAERIRKRAQAGENRRRMASIADRLSASQIDMLLRHLEKTGQSRFPP